MNCKICASASEFVFQERLLKKYDVSYYRCKRCGFIQTQEPHWLAEAYSSAITSLDIGLLSRNLFYKPIIVNLIKVFFYKDGKFVDFGGGYGVAVRLLRDAGFNFYRYDKYCENVFSQGFDAPEMAPDAEKYELLTAFEVFEHLENPLQEVEKMLQFSDSILFSTELVPEEHQEHPQKWWYIAPETGQHIAFYTKDSLALLAQHFGLNLYTNGSTLHLLTKEQLNYKLFRLLASKKFAFLSNFFTSGRRKSLLQSDFNSIRADLNS